MGLDTNQPTATTRARILVVDDDPDNPDILHTLLHPHHEVLAATSGELALRIAKPNLRPW